MTAGASFLPTVAEIDLNTLAHNIQAVQACLPVGCRLMAVVKANAYGHGAVPVAHVAVAQGIHCLGVARCHEGVTLREGGITAPIVILGPTWPEESDTLIAQRLTAVLGTEDMAEALARAAQRQGVHYPLHLKIDTGMRRFGFAPDHLPALLARLARYPQLRVEGLMTHLATADAVEAQAVHEQLALFRQVVHALATHGVQPQYIHAANSAGLYRYPESHWTMVRAGIVLYGSHPFDAPCAAPLRPVLTWKTHLARIQTMPPDCGISYGHTFVTTRPSLIGTLPVGYADGVSRRLSNVGEVLIRGRRVPMVGQVCMDMCMVDLTDLPQACVGDEVVLIGTQGQERVTADDIAARCGQISYEVFCAISQRVPRRYLGTTGQPCP